MSGSDDTENKRSKSSSADIVKHFLECPSGYFKSHVSLLNVHRPTKGPRKEPVLLELKVLRMVAPV